MLDSVSRITAAKTERGGDMNVKRFVLGCVAVLPFSMMAGSDFSPVIHLSEDISFAEPNRVL
jgi:hypothetical protein